MGSCNSEIIHDIPPWLRVYKDGTVERLVATEVVPATSDPQTGVSSKDVLVIPETGVIARLYRPNLVEKSQKLPLVIYFHGGAFLVASVAQPLYHNSLNLLVAEAKVIAVSVDYRLAPENPLPAAYEDSWAVLKWVASHNSGEGSDDWLRENVDFNKVFLAGDSAGANISHHLAIRVGYGDRAGDSAEVNISHETIQAGYSTGVNISHHMAIQAGYGDHSKLGINLRGILMIHPYFWAEDPIGVEAKDPVRKGMVDKWWKFVCPSDKGCDDPLINPFVDGGAENLAGLACDNILIFVAENDILVERGRQYYEELIKNWKGKAEIVETPGEDHVFHIFFPDSEKARDLIKRSSSFINQI